MAHRFEYSRCRRTDRSKTAVSGALKTICLGLTFVPNGIWTSGCTTEYAPKTTREPTWTFSPTHTNSSSVAFLPMCDSKPTTEFAPTFPLLITTACDFRIVPSPITADSPTVVNSLQVVPLPISASVSICEWNSTLALFHSTAPWSTLVCIAMEARG